MTNQEPAAQAGTTADRFRAFAISGDARERMSALAARYWEAGAYAALIIAAAILRFWRLGERAMHHDESLHSFYAWQFNRGLDNFFTFGTSNQQFNYHHVPFMHGPFQFIGNGFVMWIFGDGDYQARILAASMGTALVAAPFLLRRQLGVWGALFASAFIAFSPTLLYYSRFTREDMYTAFWTMGIVVGAWRYLATRHNGWLYVTAGMMAGSFLTKETTYMTVVGFLFFFDFLFAHDIADKIRAKSPMEPAQRIALTIGLMFVAWAIALGWPFLRDWRAKYDLDELPGEAVLLLVLGTLAAPLYAAILQLVPILGNHGVSADCAGTQVGGVWHWRECVGSADLHIAGAEKSFAYVTIFGLVMLAGAAGVAWNARTWLIAAAAFWVPYVLLSTTFFSNPDGFFSVIWGSLDYWVSQQHERRGDQPDYYYFMTLPVYEFVPLALATAGALYYAIRAKMTNALIVVGGAVFIVLLLQLPHAPALMRCPGDECKVTAKAGVSLFHVLLPLGVVMIGVLAFQMDRFTRFLIYWFAVTLLGLTIAGEKMPWLNVHLALPLAVLAGKFIGDLLERTDLREDLPSLERVAPFAYGAAAAMLSIFVFVTVGPFQAASFGGWALAAVAGASVWWASSGYSRQTAMQVALVSAVAAFSVFSLRAGILAAWGHPDSPYAGQPGDVARRDHGDVPVELLVYTQTSGDIPVLRDRIAEYARKIGRGRDLPIVVDQQDGFTWPWAWYLRDYKSVSYANITDNYDPRQGRTDGVLPVMLILTGNVSKVNVAGYEPGITYHHRRWFPEEYRGRGADGTYTTGDFFGDVFNPSVWGDWLDFWVRRTLPASEPGTVDAVAFFPTGAGVVDTTPKGPTVRTEGNQLVIGGQGFADGELSGPSDVAFDSEGNIYVADTNNNRVSKYDANGVFLSSFGGFRSPDITLNQPWSVAVADDGTVFIADTWNHKVIKVGADGRKIKEWGAGGVAETGGDPFMLFGPREITLTADGNVLITDTGNGRIIEYTQNGDFVRQFGEKVTDACLAAANCPPLALNEPVGVITNEVGDVYIADFWNKRVLVLTKDLQVKTTIAVESWGSRNVTDRPYLALLPDGRLLVTDPNPCPTAPVHAPEGTDVPCPAVKGRILVFGTDGAQVAAYELPMVEGQTVARAVGIATDGTSVLVADAAGSVVRKIPLADIVK